LNIDATLDGSTWFQVSRIPLRNTPLHLRNVEPCRHGHGLPIQSFTFNFTTVSTSFYTPLGHLDYYVIYLSTKSLMLTTS